MEKQRKVRKKNNKGSRLERMEKIGMDYKWRTWNIYAELFNTLKSWHNPFKSRIMCFKLGYF